MFKRLKKWTESHKTLFALIITLIFVLSQIPFLLNHEIWNDEATSWQLSQEITLTNFYEVNSAEPHPPLWQLILAPFSKLGFPILTLNIISLVLVAAAVFLVARFAPMGLFTKFIFFVSAAFFYFLPIISRSYSLVPLALACVCLVYKNRHEKPLLYGLSLAFLSQTHFLMYGLLAALGVGYVVESFVKKDKKGIVKKFALFLLPILISAATILPLVINSLKNQAILSGKYFEAEYVIEEPLLPNVVLNFFGGYNTGLEILFVILCAVVAIMFFIKNQKTFLYLASGIAFWFFVMGNIYQNLGVLSQKVSLIVLIVFAIVWINKLESTKKDNKIEEFISRSEIIKFLRTKITKDWYLVFAIIFALATIPNAFPYAVEDLYKPFSNAKEIAEYINNEIEPGSVIVEGEPSLLPSAVMAYVENDVTIYSVSLGRVKEQIDNLKYDNESVDNNRNMYITGDVTIESLGKLLEELSEQYDHVYYLGVTPACGANMPEIRAAVANTFESLETFNTNEYLDIVHTVSTIYKVK